MIISRGKNIKLRIVEFFTGIFLLLFSSQSFSRDCGKVKFMSNSGDVSVQAHMKEEMISWLKEFKIKYGDLENIHEKIVEYEAEGGNDMPLFGPDFYNEYGAYVFMDLPVLKPENRLIVMKHLLGNGIHPYDGVYGESSVAGEVVSFEDVEAFRLLIDTGKLNSCMARLEELYTVAKRTGNKKIIEMIKRLLHSS